MCKEAGASHVLGVDRDLTHWLVEDRGAPCRLRDVELATGRSTILFEVEGEHPHSWTCGAKPDWREIEARVGPDGARACVGRTTHHYGGASCNGVDEVTFEVLCGPLPAGPFERVLEGRQAAPTMSFMTPTRLLVGRTIVDLDARTTQRLELPVKSARWLIPLPGGRRVFAATSPAVLLDVERHTFSLIGRRNGEHDAVDAAPDVDRRFVLSDDATPEARAEGGRYLYWVDVGP
jgi:hypothetical protein